MPRVCKSVLHTSSGFVTAAATAPAIPPAVTCVNGEYTCVGLRSFLVCSYTENWTAVKGTTIFFKLSTFNALQKKKNNKPTSHGKSCGV